MLSSITLTVHFAPDMIRRAPWLRLMILLPLVATAAPSPEPSKAWADRVAGALCSFAIGDGMAAEFEHWTPDEIVARFGAGDFTRFVPPLAERPSASPGKGDGRISDDTLEVEALMRAYAVHGLHLDAHAYVSAFLPELTDRKVWLPEKGALLPVLDRPMWWPERYAHQRNAINHIDPRQAGQGNWLNQGLAVIIWPVGAVNAGDPAAAYAEAVAFGSAHTESYALEAAAVLAAAYAEAFGPAPTVESVLAAAQAQAKDGTALALRAVLATVDPADDPLVFAEKARRAWLPYAGLPPARLAESAPDTRKLAGTNLGRPSRIQSIESVPAALAVLKWSQGNWARALRAGILYGHDAESIAAVSSSLVAAMHGRRVVPSALSDASDLVNRRNFAEQGANFAAVAARLLERDAEIMASRRQAVFGHR